MSKAVENLVQANYMPELTPRERIKAHYKTRGKVELTAQDTIILERCERVNQILMANRADLMVAKRLIKEEFGYTHRSEIDRAIDDAQYLLGAMFKAEKDYQRLIQLNDIEFWMDFAKGAKDGYLANEMMKRRNELYRLDEKDEEEAVDYFSVIIIVQEFRAEEFTHSLAPGWEERIEAKKQELLRKVGLSGDVEDVDFEETKDE